MLERSPRRHKNVYVMKHRRRRSRPGPLHEGTQVWAAAQRIERPKRPCCARVAVVCDHGSRTQYFGASENIGNRNTKVELSGQDAHLLAGLFHCMLFTTYRLEKDSTRHGRRYSGTQGVNSPMLSS